MGVSNVVRIRVTKHANFDIEVLVILKHFTIASVKWRSLYPVNLE
jgi:hypothetical protein